MFKTIYGPGKYKGFLAKTRAGGKTKVNSPKRKKVMVKSPPLKKMKTPPKNKSNNNLSKRMVQNKKNTETHINQTRNVFFVHGPKNAAFKGELQNAIRNFQIIRKSNGKPLVKNLSNNSVFLNYLLAKYRKNNKPGQPSAPVPMARPGSMPKTRKDIREYKKSKKTKAEAEPKAKPKPQKPKPKNTKPKPQKPKPKNTKPKPTKKPKSKKITKGLVKSTSEVPKLISSLNKKMKRSKVPNNKEAGRQMAKRLVKAALQRQRTKGLRKPVMARGSGVRRM